MAFDYAGSKFGIMNERVAALLGQPDIQEMLGRQGAPSGVPPAGGEVASPDISSLFDQVFPGEGGPLNDMIMEMGKQVMSAQGAEQSAQSELRTATQAPMPQVDQRSAMVGRSLARAGGQLQMSNVPQEHMEQFLKDQQGMLLQQRTENLSRLNDQYKMAAGRAAKLGDTENAIKNLKAYDLGIEKIGKMTEMMKTIMTGEYGLEEARIRGKYGLAEAGLRAGAGTFTDEDITRMAHQAARGIPLTNFPAEGGTRARIILKMDDLGLKYLPPQARTRLDSLNGSRAVLDQIGGLLTKLKGKYAHTAKERATKGIPLFIEALAQTDPDAARLQSLVKTTLAKQVRAMGDVGTLNNDDMARAMSSMPGLTNIFEVAEGRLHDLRNVYDNVEKRTISSFTEEYGDSGFFGPGPPGQQQQGQAAPKESKVMKYLRQLGVE